MFTPGAAARKNNAEKNVMIRNVNMCTEPNCGGFANRWAFHCSTLRRSDSFVENLWTQTH